MTALWDFLTLFPSTIFYLDLFTSSSLSLSWSIFIPKPEVPPQSYVLEGRFCWSALRIHMGETVVTFSGLTSTSLHSSVIGMDKTSFSCYSQISLSSKISVSLGLSSSLVYQISDWFPLFSCIDSNFVVLCLGDLAPPGYNLCFVGIPNYLVLLWTLSMGF